MRSLLREHIKAPSLIFQAPVFLVNLFDCSNFGTKKCAIAEGAASAGKEEMSEYGKSRCTLQGCHLRNIDARGFRRSR